MDHLIDRLKIFIVPVVVFVHVIPKYLIHSPYFLLKAEYLIYPLWNYIYFQWIKSNQGANLLAHQLMPNYF
jgi:hypothetical protein